MRFSSFVMIALFATQTMATDVAEGGARLALQSYAKCIVTAHKSTVGDALSKDASGQKLASDYPLIFDPKCSSKLGRVRLQMDDGSFRAALAQAMIDVEFSDQRAFDFSKVLPLYHYEPDPLKSTNSKNGMPLPENAMKREQESYIRRANNYMISRLGECVVRHDPQAARALLSKPINSVEESISVKALSPALAACIVKGQTVALNGVTVRNTVALNFYRLAARAQYTDGGTN